MGSILGGVLSEELGKVDELIALDTPFKFLDSYDVDKEGK